METEKLEYIYENIYNEGYFEKYLTLYLIDIPTMEQLEKGKVDISTKNDNSIFVIARGYNDKIKIGTTFDAIISRKSIDLSIFHHSILKFISINPSYELDYLPKGNSGLCLLEFPDGKPDLLNKLILESKENDNKQNILILTQKPVLEKILYEYNIK